MMRSSHPIPQTSPPYSTGDALTLPPTLENPPLRHCRRFSAGASLLAIAVGCLTLFGWAFNRSSLTAVVPGLATMKPVTALCFMLCGLALWLLRLRPGELHSPHRHQVIVAQVMGGVAALIGLFTLADYFLGTTLVWNELFFSQALAATGQVHPGRMSPASALAFAGVGSSLLLLARRRLRYLSQALALLGASIGLVGLVGHVYGPSALYQMSFYSSMALHTSALFVCLGLGSIVSRPHFGVMAPITSPRLGGLMGRWLLPVVSPLPILIGWLRWKGELAGHYNTAFGLVIFTLSNVLLLNVLLWISAFWLNRVDQQRRRASESDLRLAAIVDSSESAILSKDLAGNITSWNKGAEALYGYTAAEVIGQSVNLITPPDLHAEAQHILREIMDGKPVRRAETARRHKDGSLIWVSLVVSPVRDADGRIVGASSIAHDISERKRTEAALQESEERLRLFIEHAPAALAMFDREMRYLHASRRWRTDYGLGDRALIGVSHYEIFPEIPERWKDAHRRGLEGQILNMERDSFECADGSVQWLRWEIRPWRDTHGDIGGIVIFGEDITARQEAENVLRESHARLKRVLEVETVGVMFWDLTSGHLIDANSTFLNLMGFSRRDVEAGELTWQKLTPPEYHEMSLAELRKFADSGRVGPYEKEYFHKDGSRQWFVFAGSSIGNNNCVEFCVDISDRKKAEAALQESEQRIRDLLDSTAEALLGYDLEGNCTFSNPAAVHLLGYTDASELLGKNIHQTLHHSRPDGSPFPIEECPIHRNVGAGRLYHAEDAVYFRKDGSSFTAECWAHPVSRDGSLLGGVITFFDITERKHAQEQLAAQAEELAQQSAELQRSSALMAEQARMLQSVLDSIGEGLVAADVNGKFLLWNPAADRILGRTRSDVPIGEWSRHFSVFLPDQKVPFPEEELPLARAIRGHAASSEMFIRGQDSDYGAWIEVSAQPMRDENGVVCGGVAAIRDITRRVLADRAIRDLNMKLEQRVTERTAELVTANKEMEAFSYSVSHDLRAPLRHISGFVRMLREDFGAGMDPEAQTHLRRIADSAQNMTRLVDEMLNLSQLGRQALNLQTTALNQLIEEVIALLQPDISGRRIEWKIARLSLAECDPTLMKQVFQNLISNALKYSRPRKHSVIEIGEMAHDGNPAIFVRDNGVGFDMKYADKLFTVFQRLHKGEEFEGTGVGLATVARIVQKHGGHIWAEAEKDRGATFYFTLAASSSVKTHGAASGAN